MLICYPLDKVTLGQSTAECLSVWSLQRTEAGRQEEQPLQLCSQEPGNNENPVNIQEEKQIVPWSACFITSLSPQHQEGTAGLVVNNSQLEENATTDYVWRDAIVTAR